MHRTRNAAYGQPYRGFESLPLRQSNKINNLSRCLATLATAISDSLANVLRGVPCDVVFRRGPIGAAMRPIVAGAVLVGPRALKIHRLAHSKGRTD